MAVATTVGSLSFPTKGAAKAFFREIRDRYQDGVRVGLDDESAIRDLLARHPEAREKTGAGIAFFSVATETEFRRTRHFVVHRLDGSSSDFSFHACIDGRNPDRDRLEALRRAVEDQIVAFRNQCLAEGNTRFCPLRGVRITLAASHVDHCAPEFFQALVDRWLTAGGMTLSDVQITPPADNQIVARMADREQRSSWTEYHRSHARLRLLSPRANLSDAKHT